MILNARITLMVSPTDEDGTEMPASVTVVPGAADYDPDWREHPSLVLHVPVRKGVILDTSYVSYDGNVFRVTSAQWEDNWCRVTARRWDGG